MGDRFPANNLVGGAQIRRNGLVHGLKQRTAVQQVPLEGVAIVAQVLEFHSTVLIVRT